MKRVRQFTQSLKYALRGLVYAIKNEKNFQNQLAISGIVIIAMIYFKVTRGEAIVLFAIIMAVLIMELLNTAIERAVDIIKPKIHPYAKLIKDLMAASVFMMSILAMILGIIIFLPHLISKVHGWG